MDGRGGVTIAKLTQHAQNDCFNAYLLDWIFQPFLQRMQETKTLYMCLKPFGPSSRFGPNIFPKPSCTPLPHHLASHCDQWLCCQSQLNHEHMKKQPRRGREWRLQKKLNCIFQGSRRRLFVLNLEKKVGAKQDLFSRLLARVTSFEVEKKESFRWR